MAKLATLSMTKNPKPQYQNQIVPSSHSWITNLVFLMHLLKAFNMTKPIKIKFQGETLSEKKYYLYSI